MDSPGMWHQVGFLADAFQIFKDHGMSVDLVSTSETNVTVSLDPAANSLDNDQLDAPGRGALGAVPGAGAIGPCASVSLVGRNIRAILHQLGDAFELFAEQQIYLVSQAANDLNFTFVVDENQGDRLVEQLHELLIRPARADRVLGPTWEQLFAPQAKRRRRRRALVAKLRRAELLRLLGERDCAFVYDLRQRVQAARAVQGAEVRRARALLDEGQSASAAAAAAARAGPRLRLRVARRSRASAERCPGSRSRPHPVHAQFRRRATSTLWAFEQGVQRDARQPLRARALARGVRRREICSCASIPAWAAAITGTCAPPATHSKFGVPVADLDELAEPCARARRPDRRPARAHRQRHLRCRQLGADGASCSLSWRAASRDVTVIDVGGGLGVPERSRSGRVRPGASSIRAAGGACRHCTRTWSSGSSRVATWWPRPACCWRASRS